MSLVSGYITSAQCEQALASMGIPETCRVDVPSSEDLQDGEQNAIVSKLVFIKLAKIGLANAISTFVKWTFALF